MRDDYLIKLRVARFAFFVSLHSRDFTPEGLVRIFNSLKGQEKHYGFHSPVDKSVNKHTSKSAKYIS